MKIPRTIPPLKDFLHGWLPTVPPCFWERLGGMCPSYRVSAWLNAGTLWCNDASPSSSGAGWGALDAAASVHELPPKILLYRCKASPDCIKYEPHGRGHNLHTPGLQFDDGRNASRPLFMHGADAPSQKAAIPLLLPVLSGSARAGFWKASELITFMVAAFFI